MDDRRSSEEDDEESSQLIQKDTREKYVLAVNTIDNRNSKRGDV